MFGVKLEMLCAIGKNPSPLLAKDKAKIEYKSEVQS